MKQAQADVQYVEAVKQFDQGNFEGFLEQFFLAIHSRYDIEKPVIKRFIRKKLEIINRQKKENQRLREQLYVQRKNLEKYATTGSPEYEKMVSIIAERFGLTTLKFNTLETLIESIGLPKCKVCTHCFDGSSHF